MERLLIVFISDVMYFFISLYMKYNSSDKLLNE